MLALKRRRISEKGKWFTRQGPEWFPQKGYPWSGRFLTVSLRNYCCVQNALQAGKFGLFMHTPFLDTPCGPAWNPALNNFKPALNLGSRFLWMVFMFPLESATKGRGRSGGQTAGGYPKASPRVRQPLLTVPALRELESACRVSILWDACRSTHGLLLRVLRGSPEGGSAAVCDPDPPGPSARCRFPVSLTKLSGIVSCDAAAIRIRIWIVRCQRPAKRHKHKPCETQARFSSPLLLVGSKELVLKQPNRGQFHAAIRVTTKRCDSCAQWALERRTVSRQNSWDAESLAKRYGETCH